VEQERNGPLDDDHSIKFPAERLRALFDRRPGRTPAPAPDRSIGDPG